MQEHLPLWQRIVKTILAALLTILLLAAFYLAVVMGNPQPEEDAGITANMDQPLLTALPATLVIEESNQLAPLLIFFPAPIMAAMNSKVMTFEQGICQDVPFEGGLGRTVTLTYRTAEGKAITVMSIYPARALSLVEKADYTISSMTGLPLAGLRSVRMENAATIRMHAQGTDALYVVTLPVLSATALRSLTSTLQLYQEK